jgi:excisionase family DNA binding protein
MILSRSVQATTITKKKSMTEVIVIESETFNRILTMYEEIADIAKDLHRENKRLKERKLLSTEEVAQMTGYSKDSICDKKKEIGFFTIGKEVKFKPEAVDAWIERNYINPRIV